MKTMIIYSSKYGCTEDCAKTLKSAFGNSASLVDIDKAIPTQQSLNSYYTIILGSSIYVGRISKKMRTFCTENTALLRKKRIGIFLCCAFSEQMNEYLINNFSSELLKSAIAVKNFGGEARIHHMRFLDKLIMKAVAKGNSDNLTILHKNIESFINEMVRCE